MDLFEAIEKRHSVRAFKSDPVPQELIEKLIKAAALAPSAMNEQPWKFYVATGETRAKVGEIMARGTTHLEEFIDVMGADHVEAAVQWYSELGHAPVVIVCTMPKATDDFWRMNKHLSIGAAIENLLLAATAVGLGACSITFSYYVRDELVEALAIPEDRTMISIIALGYPGDEQPDSPDHDFDVAIYLD